MSLPTVTVLKGDASYDQGYHNQEGRLLPPSKTPMEKAQEMLAQEEIRRRAEAAGRVPQTAPLSTASGMCFGRDASGRLFIGIGSELALASSTSVSRDGGGWVFSRS